MIELHPAVKALLVGPNPGHLATVLPDGSPHSVPLWVDLEGDRLVFFARPESRKIRNIELNPRVAISVTDNKQHFSMAAIRGRVTGRIEGENAQKIVHRISMVYTGKPYHTPEGRVVFLVEPEHVSTTAMAYQ